MAKKKQQEKTVKPIKKNKGGAPIGNKNALGNKGGGVSKYDPKYCDMLVDYFLSAQPKTEYKRIYAKDGSIKSEEPFIQAPPLPTFQEFATDIGVTAKCLADWKDKYVEFGEAYARARDWQHHLMIVFGMQGQYNAAFTTMMMKNLYGYEDKVKTENKTVVAEATSIEAFLKSTDGADM